MKSLAVVLLSLASVVAWGEEPDFPDCFVEYVESKGAQSVDTGVVFDDNANPPRVVARAMVTTGSDLDVAGTDNNVAIAGCFIIDVALAKSAIYYRYGNTNSKSITVSSADYLNRWADYDFGPSVRINGQEVLAELEPLHGTTSPRTPSRFAFSRAEATVISASARSRCTRAASWCAILCRRRRTASAASTTW